MTHTSVTAASVVAALRALVVPRRRLALVLVTAALGLVTALGLAVLLGEQQRTFVGIVQLTQLVMSVLTPFATALLLNDAREAAGTTGLSSLPDRWTAAAIYGVATGLYGAVVAALATIVLVTPGAPTTVDPWSGSTAAVLGSLFAQLIPVGVGCGAGLLISRPLRAELATVLVPLAASATLARWLPAGATEWITPLAAISHLMPGPMTALHWAQWVVTAALWVVLPNAIGAHWLRRRIRLRSRVT